MAKVRNVEDRLREAVQVRLEELTVDHENLTIDFQFGPHTNIEFCQGEDDQPAHISVSERWRLSLHLMEEEVGFFVCGSVPFSACLDGDSDPVGHLCTTLWENYSAGRMLRDLNFDEILREAQGEE